VISLSRSEGSAPVRSSSASQHFCCWTKIPYTKKRPLGLVPFHQPTKRHRIGLVVFRRSSDAVATSIVLTEVLSSISPECIFWTKLMPAPSTQAPIISKDVWVDPVTRLVCGNYQSLARAPKPCRAPKQPWPGEPARLCRVNLRRKAASSP